MRREHSALARAAEKYEAVAAAACAEHAIPWRYVEPGIGQRMRFRLSAQSSPALLRVAGP
jgi:hypothetical protein